MKQKVILLDINETVLSLQSLRTSFAATFGHEHLTDTWFAMVLHASTVSVVTGVKTNFANLAKISLETLAARLRVNLSEQTIADILQVFASLKPHSDIVPALLKLRAAGFQIVALSNSSLGLITKQIQNSGLSDYFEDLISVEEAATFKPSREAYQLASHRLGRQACDLRLVACHDWDTHGAICAGLHAAYIDRAGAVYNPLYKKPKIYASTMHDVADLIISSDA